MVSIRELMHATPQPDTVIAQRYQLRQLLGRGGFGEVWQAHDSQQGREVALKLLLPMQDVAIVERFKEEFALLTRLSHPHINAVYDFGRDPVHGYFFTAELVSGCSLQVATKGKSAAYVESLIMQVVRALNYLHSRDVYHFDIKPGNVLVEDADGPTPRVKVIDFGLAALRAAIPGMGTPSFMAPEMILGQVADGRADLYAVGVMLYVCLTRRNPFRQATVEQTQAQQLQLVPPPPSAWVPTLPGHLDDIVQRLLQKLPADRYATAAHVLRDWQLRTGQAIPVEAAETRQAYLPAGGMLIGRERERAQLRACIPRAVATAATAPGDSVASDAVAPVTLVLGGTGMGKTALLRALQCEAQLADCSVISNLGSAGAIDEIWVERCSALLVAAPTPTLIVLDDIDAICADGSAARGEKPLRILWERMAGGQMPHLRLVAAARQVPERLPTSTILPLAPLTVDAVQEYLGMIVGQSTVQLREFAQALHARSGGNPAHLRHIVHALLAQGALVDPSGVWDAAQFEDISIDLDACAAPVDLVAAMRQHLCALPEGQRALVRWCVLWEGPISGAVLRGLCRGAEIRGSLTELLHGALVEHDAVHGTYTVVDAQVREAVLGMLSATQRTVCEDAIVAWLTAHGAELIEILRHQAYGSDAHAAHEALLSLCHYERDHQRLTRAMARLQERLAAMPPPAWRHAYQLLLAKLSLQADQPRVCIEVVTNALAEMESPVVHALPDTASGNQDPRLECWELLGRAQMRCHAVTAAREIFTTAQYFVAPGSTWFLRLENNIARTHFEAGELTEAERLYRRTAQEATRLPERERMLIDNNELGQVLLLRREYTAAAAVLSADVQMARTTGLARVLSSRLYQWGEALRQQGALEAARRCLTEAADVGRAQQQLQLLATIYNGLGNVEQMAEDYAAAADAYERGLTLCYRVGALALAATMSVNLARVWLQGAQGARADAALRATRAYLEGRHDRPAWVEALRIAVYHLLGECALRQQRWPEADTHLQTAWTLAGTEAPVAQRFAIALARARVAHALGEHAASSQYLQRAANLRHSPSDMRAYEQVRAQVE